VIRSVSDRTCKTVPAAPRQAKPAIRQMSAVPFRVRTVVMSLNLQHITAAAVRLLGQAIRTPLVENRSLNERVGGRVLLKLETLQHTGSFKFRGAFNRLSQLSDRQLKTGVSAFSSGNHAQGVALAARMLGCPAVIVMPQDAPQIKIQATRDYGAEIRLFDRYSEDRELITRQIANQRGMTVVPAFDDLDVMAGQGSVGLETVEQLEALGVRADQLIAPVGGGGLMSGICTAITAMRPDLALYGAEPADFDDTYRSLVSGSMQSNSPDARSICDALMAPAPGKLTFPILQRALKGVHRVTDAEVRKAIKFAASGLKLIVEPGGSVGLAAILAKPEIARDRTTVVVLSGGNIDPHMLATILSETD